MPGLIVDSYIAFLIRALIIAWRKSKSRNWPVVTGTILGSRFERAAYGWDFAEIRYRYGTSGNEGCIRKPFLSRDNGEAFVRHFPAGAEIAIRVNPGDRTKSFPVRG